ncbi:type II toxin-antitoxin system VapC family toxin, partial [Acetobacter sp. DmW_125123]
MKVLLDTHALLWWLSDSDRLGETAREIIADPAHDILV